MLGTTKTLVVLMDQIIKHKKEEGIYHERESNWSLYVNRI